MPTNQTPHPGDDPLVAELLDSATVRKFKRIHFLRAGAVMLEQAMTDLNPAQKAKLDALYKAILDLAEEEAEMAPVRVTIGDSAIWPDDADCFEVENAPAALRTLLAGRTVGTRGRIEAYNGDRYELVEAYEVTADGVRMTERRAPA